MNSITYVGLDVHKATVSVAVAESGRSGEVRQVGTFANRADVLRKMVERLTRRGGQLSFCYEAGPCGYGLHRLLSGLGHGCTVVAPSLIPIKAGDRIKTDRRDAVMLAKLHRAGELTAVWVPDAAHEAMRDLVRARATAAKVAFQGAPAPQWISATAWQAVFRSSNLDTSLSALADDRLL
jgi:transposase